jgi:mono/diheme cytochrome c family protein
MIKNLIPALCLVWLSAVLAPAYAANDSTLVSTGEYLARAGDCAACHTVPGGKPFAGGLKMVTPMGAIYSTNITPDRESGIGRYSEAKFIRAVREGVAQDGHRLYPAMPFPSYAKISDEDMHTLYTWFMQEVPPRRPGQYSVGHSLAA